VAVPVNDGSEVAVFGEPPAEFFIERGDAADVRKDDHTDGVPAARREISGAGRGGR
jgi:hypothetical protein